MSPKHILVVDDDPNVLEILDMYLNKEGYKVSTASDGSQALEKTKDVQPDLVILDIMMPQLDGHEVLRHIRQKSQLPVIFLSAKEEEFDRVLGLELGADDYVTKPFSPREMVARVKAILKRTVETAQKNKRDLENSGLIEFPDLTINPVKREVIYKDEIIDLAPKEYELLLLLARNSGRAFERETLYERVWGQDSYGDFRSVDVHINWLRQKISADYIKTVWGVGYKFEVDQNV